jgi:hypothetical protein
VRAVPVACKLSTIEERRQEQRCLFGSGDCRNKGHNPEKLSWVRFPVKMASVSRKLSTVEERRQDQSWLVWRGDYSNKGHNPENVSWVRVPMKTISISETNHDRKNKIVCFGEEITGTKVTNPKTVLGSSLGADVGFRDHNFFLSYDQQ